MDHSTLDTYTAKAGSKRRSSKERRGVEGERERRRMEGQPRKQRRKSEDSNTETNNGIF